MRRVITKLKPSGGFSYLLHWSLVGMLPIALFVLVRIGFVELALIVIVLSKWRMFAVRPRYWSANIRANAIDIIVSLSILAFMTQTDSMSWQLVWVVLYMMWLLFIKPSSDVVFISLQAFIGQLLGLIALFLVWSDAPLYGLVLATGLVCYLAARHYFDSFDEPYNKFLAYLWGYFAAALAWVLGHWLLFYGVISQPALLLIVIGYGLAALYYLDHHDRLSRMLRREFIIIMMVLVVLVLAFSNWGNKII